MYIAQFVICISQMCSVFGKEPYVVHQSLESCNVTADVQMKELLILLKDQPVVIKAFCVDVSEKLI